jgi:hypothetical protein
MAEKQLLALEELESQMAFVLPERELMQTQVGLVNVGIGNLVVNVPIAVAANICGLNVNVLAAQLNQGNTVECDAASESAGAPITVFMGG